MSLKAALALSELATSQEPCRLLTGFLAGLLQRPLLGVRTGGELTTERNPLIR